MGFHFHLQCMKVKSEIEVAQSCPTQRPQWTAAYQAPPLNRGKKTQEIQQSLSQDFKQWYLHPAGVPWMLWGSRLTLCSQVNQRCILKSFLGAVLRWWRNRMGRPLSPSQIHQKNISMLSKFHKTTSECWQRTSGTQKSRSLSSKTGRKKYKR